ncbi:hypothetical protein AB4Y45_32715 [Paraburkholderia sp. EG287A]|uniref:hypothetical protein n=1 Tax=Paraburkholderia sp. EG287A TaxID=3237012 RepID=UPI0034D1E45C
MLEITDVDLNQIKDDLRTEYSDEAEIEDMLKSADIRKTEEGITVTYDNGNQDVYTYHRVLRHSSHVQTRELPKPGTPEFREMCRVHDTKVAKAQRESFANAGWLDELWPVWRDAWRLGLTYYQNRHNVETPLTPANPLLDLSQGYVMHPDGKVDALDAPAVDKLRSQLYTAVQRQSADLSS